MKGLNCWYFCGCMPGHHVGSCGRCSISDSGSEGVMNAIAQVIRVCLLAWKRFE